MKSSHMLIKQDKIVSHNIDAMQDGFDDRCQTFFDISTPKQHMGIIHDNMVSAWDPAFSLVCFQHFQCTVHVQEHNKHSPKGVVYSKRPV